MAALPGVWPRNVRCRQGVERHVVVAKASRRGGASDAEDALGVKAASLAVHGVCLHS
jgi:hypothetical protein